jgi:hypothetical protein
MKRFGKCHQKTAREAQMGKIALLVAAGIASLFISAPFVLAA